MLGSTGAQRRLCRLELRLARYENREWWQGRWHPVREPLVELRW
jgi:hypothetical protein